ncbi:MAG: hypothetical protein R6V27_08155 [Balneolaceae bacterium]
MKTHEFHIALLMITLVAASVISYNYLNSGNTPGEGSTFTYECDISAKKVEDVSPIHIEPPQVSRFLKEREKSCEKVTRNIREKLYMCSERYRSSDSALQLFKHGFMGRVQNDREVSAPKNE